MSMLDPQRNLLTVILVAGLGALGIAGGLMLLLLGRVDIDRIATDGGDAVEDVQVDVPETGLAEFDEYTRIMERPVFFSDRRLPPVELASLEVEDDDETDLDEIEEEIADLSAAVAGIVITPEVKLAMVRDEEAGKTVVLREGMSLEGEQAAWRIESILPREVSFVSVDGRQAALELQVHTSGLTVETPRPESRLARQAERAVEPQPDEAAEAADQDAEEVSDEARARAEEIRRRVAERRAELRAEAERRARQQQRQDNDG
ncbi:hypothetical protein IC757_02505 [Wenzhouxiangella sp. AB-CW3]|uniref:hypothetical protein n=1 Tax=Wenzhouxiangella sp. AB-CW3 TaxID=2771012 RepID=UPI00168BF087|nr:hypothetical protein [Wenzhouxiangella sp. AB-CW3]QOC23049.1 hypothetical protein IC757_02505 [Wenzhouxiangella sp. AB-CW3]